MHVYEIFELKYSKHNKTGAAVSTLISLNVFGTCQPDTTGHVISTLINHGVDIIELSQSASRGCISMTLTCRMKDQAHERPFPDVIHGILGKKGLKSSHQLIAKKDEKPCQRKAEAPVLTMIGSGLTADHFAQVLNSLSSQEIYTCQVSTLATPCDNTPLTCIEIKLEGRQKAVDKFSTTLQALSDELHIDLVLQTNATCRKNYQLAVFDMDSTLIKAEVIDCLAEAAGVGAQVASITEQAMRGELDFNDSFRRRLAMLKGLDESVLQNIANELPIMDGADKLIRNLKALGFKTAIVSGGFTYFAQHLQTKLGIDEVYANELEIINNKVTGQVKGQIINGTRKAQLLEQIADHEDLELSQVIAVGDGANDLPMLGKAGLGIAFRAKPIVRNNARHAITVAGLDGILHILGFKKNELV